jgi:tetratricopeptide (TPR) repeat protein
MFYAHLLMILHRSDEAIDQAEEALRRDPLRPFILALYSVVLRNTGDYELAKTQVEKALSIDPDHPFAKLQLHEVHYLMGNHKKAFELYLEGKKFVFDEETISELLKTFDEQGQHAALEKVLIEYAKSTRDRYSVDIAGIYAIVNKYDEALICLEKAYEMRKPSMPYLSTGNWHDSIRNDPRFINLLEKMNLPLPED